MPEISQETNDTIEKKTENNPMSPVGITICDWDANTCKKETVKSVSTPKINSNDSNDSNDIQKIKSRVTWYADTQEKHQVVKTDKLAEYGNTGCRVCNRGVQNWKYFCLKINIPKRNY